jgi:MarR family transcriptional regulator, transcriptional regulator for hemolysin
MDILQERFGHLMADTARIWRIYLNEQLKPVGLSYAKWSAMFLLSRYKEGIVQSELARLLSIENPTLARILNDLEKNGWIKRPQHPEDKRAKIVLFTKEGRQKFEETKILLATLREQVLMGIEKERLQIAVEVLQMIFDNLTGL